MCNEQCAILSPMTSPASLCECLTMRQPGFQIRDMTTEQPRLTRRRFLYASSAFTAGLLLPARHVRGAVGPRRASPNEKLNIASIGAAGQGASDTDGCAGENIVALCDVDATRLAERGAKYPKAKRYRDYRKMLEEMKEIDAVIVSTPDHHHAFAAVLAMKLGKHVYCQKPLAHSVWEARFMRELAARQKVVTQMGNQGHSYDSTRRIVELVPAPARPYQPDYLPFKWRGWWDFGTGALGDMACHNADAAFWALKLDAPIRVAAESSGVNSETCPKWSIIRYEFPARGDLPPLTLTWYDGGKLPSRDLAEGADLPKNGTIIVGAKGIIVFRDWHPDGFRLLPADKFKDFKGPEPTIRRAPNGPYREWIDACKGGPMCLSNFDYSGRLAETVLLGNVALRVGRKFEWDGKELRARNCPEAAQYIRREYRKGWKLEGGGGGAVIRR